MVTKKIKMLLALLVIKTIISVSAFNLPDNQTLIESKAGDFIFDIPDVVKDYVRDDGTQVRLNAYKTSRNQALINDGKFTDLRWVSFGKPEIIKINNNQDLFQTQSKLSFSLHFEMLKKRDKEELANEVKRAKGFVVDAAQFLDITANKIQCSIKLYDQETKKAVLLRGNVFDLIQSPYLVDFEYSIDTKERLLFEQEIKNEPIKFNFQCSISAGAKITKTNTFSITVEESNNIRLSEKLFGPASEAYVTRDQLTQLSNEVNSVFNVVETYEMPQDQFSSAFVDNIISLAGQTTFNPVSFDDALKSLSKYSLDFSGDLKPDVITKELSDLFKVEKIDEKTHIIFDQAHYKELEKQSASSSSKTGSFQLFEIGGGSKTSQFAQSQKDKWIDQGTSLDDQLKELNAYSENQIKYEFEGNKIVPKALNVNKLQSSSFKKTLVFNRIKQIIEKAEFDETFSLNTEKATTKIERKYPNYSIIMLGSEDQLKYFDENGKGFDEFNDWYLCDGRNGSPDLRLRFPYGRTWDNRIGQTGGTSHIYLSEAHMPSHNHIGFFLIYFK